MISIATVFCVLISLLVSLVLPVVLLIFFALRNKKQGIPSAWLLGAAGFFVTQILISGDGERSKRPENLTRRFNPANSVNHCFKVFRKVGYDSR